VTFWGGVDLPSALLSPFSTHATAKTVEVGAHPAHKGKETPEKRAGENMGEDGARKGEKVHPPGDEQAPQNNAGMAKKKESYPVFCRTHRTFPSFLPVL
jgi:hypothetical protein